MGDERVRHYVLAAACLLLVILAGLGSKKLALAYPESAWLIGTYGGLIQFPLLWRMVRALSAPAAPGR